MGIGGVRGISGVRGIKGVKGIREVTGIRFWEDSRGSREVPGGSRGGLEKRDFLFLEVNLSMV